MTAHTTLTSAVVVLASLAALIGIFVSIYIFKLARSTNSAKAFAVAGISTACSVHLVVFNIHHMGEAFLADNIVNLTISESLGVAASILLIFAIYKFDRTPGKHYKD